ncbi:MAG: hypothetical protein J6Y02_16340 [Pseudobutyrivibrio sp.]|nr:hypothetical protein [Pseudobutyrivibrio sp.]
MSNLLAIADGSVDILKKNLPKVLLATGIGSGALAIIGSGIASFKASDIVKDIHSKPNLDRKTIAKEYFTKIVPLYIPVVILETGSVICLVKSYDIQAKRLAAATALAQVSIETLRIYREKAKKMLGEDKAKELDHQVREEQVRKDEEKRKSSDGETFYNYDLQWFRDSLSEQEFVSTVNDITRANLKFSERLNAEGQMSKNEWLDILKEYSTPVGERYMIGSVPGGEEVGWLNGQTMHVYMDKVGKTKVGNHPCIILTYSDQPFADYRNVHYGRYY